MEKYQEILARRKWGNKVRIVGLSIDENAAIVKKYVQKKELNEIHHYHVENGVCTACEFYGIGSVPHAFLVNKDAKIVFKGDPSTRNFEEDIDNLLKGKEVVEAKNPAAVEEEDLQKQDLDAINNALAEFDKNIKDFIKEVEVKEQIKGLIRGICALVNTIEIKKHEGQEPLIIRKPVCHTQLVGKKKNIDKMLEVCKQINQSEHWINEYMTKEI